jgi:hypothetical protein
MRRSRLLPSAVETPDRPSPAATAGSAPRSGQGGRRRAAPAAVTDDESDASEIEDLTQMPAHRAPHRAPAGANSKISVTLQDPYGLPDTVDARATTDHTQAPREVGSSALGKRACLPFDEQVEPEHAKKRKGAEERATAKQERAAQAEAAKRQKLHAREQARVAKEAAKAALKDRKEHAKETKRKTSGKCSHENVFVSICAQAAGDASDDAMQAILAALEKDYPGQTQRRSQRVEGAITFQRFVYAVDEDHHDESDGAATAAAEACARREETAPQVIFYMRPSRLVELVTTDGLLPWATAAAAQYSSHTAPLLMVVALDQHLRRNFGSSSRRAAQARIDDALAQLLVNLRMGCRSGS